MSFKKLVSSSICTVVLCAAVSAQETKPNTSAVPQKGNANEGASKMSSHPSVTPEQIAACWALDNQEEVILAKFAQEKTKNKEVTAFAKMVAEEHQACLKKLSKYAPEASRDGYLVSNQADVPKSRNESTSSGTANTDPSQKQKQGENSVQNSNSSGTATAGIDMMQLQREIAQQCISDSKKYLNSKDANEFDKCFVGIQIAKHAAMRTKLIVFQRHTSAEMQQMVTEGIQSTEKHLKAAEALMATLDDADATTSSKKNNK